MSQARLECETPERWRLSGELTLATVPAIAEQGNQLIAGLAADGHLPQKIQLDLGGVTHAQSVAIALMLEWQALLREHGLSLLIQDCPEGLHRIAQFSNVDALIGLEDNPESH